MRHLECALDFFTADELRHSCSYDDSYFLCGSGFLFICLAGTTADLSSPFTETGAKRKPEGRIPSRSLPAVDTSTSSGLAHGIHAHHNRTDARVRLRSG
jgi:hypothetical protein